MENSAQHPPIKQTAPDRQGNDSPPVILFTTFGTGKSYIFHVEKPVRYDKNGAGQSKTQGTRPDRVLECWKEVFGGQTVWDYKRLGDYYKPLGETATIKLDLECKEASALANACDDELTAELIKVEAVFFTTGVAVLVVGIKPNAPDDILKYALKNDSELLKVNLWTKNIIELCKSQYLEIMNKAVKRSKIKHTEVREQSDAVDAKPKWFLSAFEEVDRKDWDPKGELSYPLFFVDKNTYKERIRQILEKVSGSAARKKRQEDKATVSYQKAEIYVDWSEALVRNGGKSQQLIENNFIIALASWYALALMNKNSSMFLFEAYLETVTDKPLSNADAVNKRNMAYKDVADASLPIRWTIRRRDLFLLETIHRNWSSDRWRKNIEERMKLLVLHYRNLEDIQRHTENERRDFSTRTLSLIAVLLTAVTLVSAITDLINLSANSEGDNFLKKLGFYASLGILSLTIILLIVGLPVWFFRQKAKLPSHDHKDKRNE